MKLQRRRFIAACAATVAAPAFAMSAPPLVVQGGLSTAFQTYR